MDEDAPVENLYDSLFDNYKNDEFAFDFSGNDIDFRGASLKRRRNDDEQIKNGKRPRLHSLVQYTGGKVQNARRSRSSSLIGVV